MSTFSSIIAGFGGQGSLLKKFPGVLPMVPKCVAVLQT